MSILNNKNLHFLNDQTKELTSQASNKLLQPFYYYILSANIYENICLISSLLLYTFYQSGIKIFYKKEAGSRLTYNIIDTK